jgi:hypothetical protein
MKKIPIFSKRYRKLKAIIDDENFEEFSKYKWGITSAGYIFRFNSQIKKMQTMHICVTNCPPGFVVHHKNGNMLDNRKTNLLVCTQKEHRAIHATPSYKKVEIFRNYILVTDVCYFLNIKWEKFYKLYTSDIMVNEMISILFNKIYVHKNDVQILARALLGCPLEGLVE